MSPRQASTAHCGTCPLPRALRRCFRSSTPSATLGVNPSHITPTHADAPHDAMWRDKTRRASICSARNCSTCPGRYDAQPRVECCRMCRKMLSNVCAPSTCCHGIRPPFWYCHTTLSRNSCAESSPSPLIARSRSDDAPAVFCTSSTALQGLSVVSFCNLVEFVGHPIRVSTHAGFNFPRFT